MVLQFKWKKNFLLQGLISRKLCWFLLMFSYFLLFLYQSPSWSLYTVFWSIIDEVLLITSSANAFAFGDFNVHHEDWLTYHGGTDRPGGRCYNFLSQMTLNRWLTFLLRSLTVTLAVMLFWIYFSLLMLVFVLQWLSLHWEILIMLLSQFPLTLQQAESRMPRFMA